MTQPMSLPVNLKIGGRLCIIIGGGHVARRKCLKLLDYGARVRVVAPDLDEWDSVPKQEALELIRRPFEEGDLAGAFLVIAATDDPDLNDRITSRAGESGILSLSVDSPESSDFFFPATLKRGDLTVSFSTNGAIPALSSKLMKEAEEQFGSAHEEFCVMARSIRKEAIRRIPAPFRKAFFQELVDSDLINLLEQGKTEQAGREAQELLEKFCTSPPPSLPPQGGGAVGKERWGRSGGKGTVGEERWERSGGKGAVGEERWERSGGGGAVGKERWERNGGGGTVGKERWERSGEGGAVGKER